MNRHDGVSIVEMLVAIAILGIIFAIVGTYLAQQSRVTALSQSVNAVELTSRTVAEAVIQDFQMAGGRAVVIGGTVSYADIRSGCEESDRSTCIELTTATASGSIATAADPASANGVAIFYRTSLAPAAPCRRVDVFVLDRTMYRSDVPCVSGGLTVNLDDVAFASNIEAFSVTFECSDGGDDEFDPAECYGTSGEFVRQAVVDVTVSSSGRTNVEGGMRLEAVTPNMRPSVNYGRTGGN